MHHPARNAPALCAEQPSFPLSVLCVLIPCNQYRGQHRLFSHRQPQTRRPNDSKDHIYDASYQDSDGVGQIYPVNTHTHTHMRNPFSELPLVVDRRYNAIAMLLNVFVKLVKSQSASTTGASQQPAMDQLACPTSPGRVL